MNEPANAFPHPSGAQGTDGLTKREWFAGMALANPAICTGTAPEWQLQKWFGNRMGLTSQEIAAKQAVVYADAMIEAGKEKP